MPEPQVSTPRVVTGVAEIALNVRDLPRMKRFYQEVLGFHLRSEACHEKGPIPDPQGEPTIVFLSITDMDTALGTHGHPLLLALIDHRRHVFARDRFDGHKRAKSTLNHLAFEIPPDRYELEHDRLQRLGLKPRRAAFPNMQARALFFEDPEGNQLELICYEHTMKSNCMDP